MHAHLKMGYCWIFYSKIWIYYCNFILSYNLGTVQAIILHITVWEANTSTGARSRTFTLSELQRLWATSDCECRARNSLGFQSCWSYQGAPDHSTSCLTSRTVVTCSNRCTPAQHPRSRLCRGRRQRRGDVAGTDGCAGKSTGRRSSPRPRPPGGQTSSLKTTDTAPSARISISETSKCQIHVILFNKVTEMDPCFIFLLLKSAFWKIYNLV